MTRQLVSRKPRRQSQRVKRGTVNGYAPLNFLINSIKEIIGGSKAAARIRLPYRIARTFSFIATSLAQKLTNATYFPAS